MLATVSLERLDQVKCIGEDGKRSYVAKEILLEDFRAIIQGVLVALGLENLTI